MSLDDISSYDRLYTTCTSSLPTEPLLRALALCSSNPVDPCYGVDCGDHGQCADGSCQCESGYSGAVCESGCLFPTIYGDWEAGTFYGGVIHIEESHWSSSTWSPTPPTTITLDHTSDGRTSLTQQDRSTTHHHFVTANADGTLHVEREEGGYEWTLTRVGGVPCV